LKSNYCILGGDTIRFYAIISSEESACSSASDYKLFWLYSGEI